MTRKPIALKARLAVDAWLWDWTMNADYDTYAGNAYIGQDERGDWWAPKTNRPGADDWSRLNLWNPRHLRSFLQSRRDGRASFLEFYRD